VKVSELREGDAVMEPRSLVGWTLVSILVGALFCADPVHAQSIFGAVLGTVKDTSGGLVPNATVLVTNVDENTTRTAATNANGEYEALNVKPGRYRVEVIAEGFETFATSEVRLDARQTLRVDATLEVGGVAETVTIRAAGIIASETHTIASAFSEQPILGLPANYRASGSTSPYILISALPGVQGDNANNFSIQGALPSQSQYSVDGISTTNVRGNAPLRQAFPSAESLAEIKVQAVGNAAEYGQVADVTTISRSGTNTVTGTVFWYHQNDGLDATPFGALSKPERTGNDYGVSGGGRVVIPGLYDGHSRTFFYATFERFQFPRERIIQNSVPTERMRNGDFSLEPATILDPATGQPFPGNRIPADRISPIARAFLDLYPPPNAGATDVQRSANFVRNAPNDLTSNQYDVRVDHYLTDRQSIFGRWTWKNVAEENPTLLTLPSRQQFDHYRLLVVSHNYTITSNLLNEARFGLTTNNDGGDFPLDGREFTNALGLQGIGPTFPFNGLPVLSFSGVTSNLGLGRVETQSQSRSIQIANNLTWTKGRHTVKSGLDFRRIRAATPLGFLGGDNYGNFSFNGAFTGSDVADFLLGLPARSAFAIVHSDNDGRGARAAFFAQDTYRVNQKLTLQYGLRYEVNPAFTDASGNIGNFDPSVPRSGRVVFPTGKESLLAPGFLQTFNACPAPDANGAPCTPVVSAAEAGLPEGLRSVPALRLMPRAGFAYRPFGDDRTVVRGGIGGYNGQILGNVFFTLTGTLQSDVREFPNFDVLGRPVFQWPAIQTGGSGIVTGDFGTASFRTAADIDWKDPYTVQWNLSVDRNVGRGTGVRISYIGMKTTQLVYAPNLNQMARSTEFAVSRPLSDRPFPNWNIVFARSVGSTSHYNALQTEVNRRFSGGVAFTSTYTFAKHLADNGGPTPTGFPSEVSGGRTMDSFNRRAEYGNVYATRRHRWISTLIYDLPVGRGRPLLSSSHPIVDGIAGGWQVSAICLVQSGPFLTPFYSGIDPSGTGSGLIIPQHPDLVDNPRRSDRTRDQWFDTTAFVCPGQTARTPCRIGVNPATDAPPIGRFGNAGVGSIEGPGTVSLSLGVIKSFGMPSGASLDAGISFTNVLNRVNLADPNLNAGSADFGRITSARAAELGGARTGQVSVRLRF
jgi:hypothetical protein